MCISCAVENDITLKFKYSEKATEVWKNLVLMLLDDFKRKWDIVSNFVAFSQYLNLNILSGAWNLDWLILIFERSRLVKNSTLESLIFYFILIMTKNKSTFSLTWTSFTSLVPNMNIWPIDQKMAWNSTFDFWL